MSQKAPSFGQGATLVNIRPGGAAAGKMASQAPNGNLIGEGRCFNQRCAVGPGPITRSAPKAVLAAGETTSLSAR